jgi:hypothetical protein
MKTRYLSVYKLELNENGHITRIPFFSVTEEAFRVSYKSGDYEELSDTQMCMIFRQFASRNFGCRFRGDVTCTGGIINSITSDMNPCDSEMVIESNPFVSYSSQHPVNQ